MSVTATKWAWDQHVPSLAKFVLVRLADHADNDGFCWPGQEGIAEKCSITPRTLRRHLSWLEAEGFIARRKRRGQAGEYQSDSYQLDITDQRSHLTNGQPRPAVTGGRHQRSHLTARPAVTPDRLTVSKPLTTIEPSIEYSSEIQEIFEYWKTKTGRNGRTTLTRNRRDAVKTRLKEYSKDDILRAIDGCAASDFHMGRDSKNGFREYSDLTLICRNGEKLEAFRDAATQAKSHPRKRVPGEGYVFLPDRNEYEGSQPEPEDLAVAAL